METLPCAHALDVYRAWDGCTQATAGGQTPRRTGSCICRPGKSRPDAHQVPHQIR